MLLALTQSGERMSLSEYLDQHEEQAFIVKALATAVAITLIKNFFPGLVGFLFLIFPAVFLIGIRMHAATSGVDSWELLREHVTFLPVMRSEDERRSEVKPWVTYGIILANVLIFYFIELRLPQQVITDNYVFLPHKPDPFNVPLSAFTALFLHAGNGHLWGNMTFLWVVGSAVERRVGRLRFAWLYLVTGLIGGLVFILVEYLFHGRAGHALGASGAIAGIMGIFAIRCYFKTMIFPLPILGIFSLILPISLKIRLNSLLIMALFFISDLSGGIEQIAGEGSSMVGHWAHLGGMISGMLIAGYLKLGEEAVEERHLEIGIRASQATMGYQGGERSLQIALERNPNSVDALLGMARLKSKFQGSQEGMAFYEKSLQLLLRERPLEVVAVTREYLTKYHAVPRDPGLVWRLAEELRKAGETELLLPFLEQFVELTDTAPQQREKALYQLATLLEFTSCFEAARSCFARFAYEYPGSILADKATEKAAGEIYRPPVRPAEAKAAVRICPACGKEMAVRTASSGPKQGESFWVCAGFPSCRTVQPVAEPAEDFERASAVIARPAPQRYRLVFDGTIGFTCDPVETKLNLVQLFRCSNEQVEKLLSGTPTVLKRGLDHAAAIRYKNAISRTGALCSIEAEEVQPVPVPAAVPQPAATAATLSSASVAPTAVPPAPAFTCPKCGMLQEKGECCVSCGVYFAKIARRAEQDIDSFKDRLPGGNANPVMSEARERHWAMLCHLMTLSGFLIPFGNFLGPFIIWRWKRGESDFVDYHGKAILNYQISVLVCMVGLIVVSIFTGFTAIFVGPLFGILGLYTLVMVAVGAIKSRRGDYVAFALSSQFIK